MDGDPSQRREKRSKGNYDPVDWEIRGLVFQELQGSSDQQQGHSHEQQVCGRGSRKAQPRRGSGQGSGSGAGRGSVGRGAMLDMEKDLSMMEEEKERPYP